MTSIRVTQNAWNKISDIIKQSNNKFGFIYLHQVEVVMDLILN